MPAPSPANILIVDDDLGLLRLVQKALKREGFRTATAGSGREAMDWLAANRADLMLLDLKLPDLEGNQLINRLADTGQKVPFIIITGQGDERVAVDMMKRGALDYLVKDVKFIEFVPTVVLRSLEKLETDKRLAAAQAALEESQKQVLMVSEREQRRFGAELHDGLGQQLTAIELRCQSLRQDLPPARPDLEREVSQICQFLREAIGQTRLLACGLAPLSLDSRGLAEALSGLAARMSKDGQIKCALDSPLPVTVDDDLVAVHLFRIAQEAVNNAVKHSGASRIVIHLGETDEAVHLVISDNGQGLPKTPNFSEGIGLQIMKHRASAIGAELKITSKDGEGVHIDCALPKRRR